MSVSDVYGAFVDYYGDLPLKMIRSENGYDIYACKVSSGLSQNRFIFTVVYNSQAKESFTPLVSEVSSLNKLNWISFQTRTTDDNYDVPTVNHYSTPEKKYKLPDELNVITRDREITKYSCASLPISINLVHDSRKNNMYQYPDTCKLYQALETYNAVVELL